MTPANRDILLARVSDLLRRSGTEDAERLIRDLETVVGGPVFSVLGNYAFAFHAIVPPGDILADRPIVHFLTPAHSSAFTSHGVFPFPFACRETHAAISGPGSAEVPVSALYLVHRAAGVEVARFPMEAFCGPFALEFERNYGPNAFHDIELWAARHLHSSQPWAAGLVLSGSLA